ncbi:MAG TPA: Sec-independent protein translocase subunit TatA [Streptosporangiaceae bacterium]|nr:Sec-independent protein translocase subunit TatA [Streptosporangiaceae bacterium]
MTGLFDAPHLLIILLVLVLLFGSAKLPRLAKSLGESMRIFKNEAKNLHDDDGAANTQQAQQAVQVQPPAQQLPAAAPAVTTPSMTAQPNLTVQLPDGTTVTGTPVEAPPTNQPG